MIDQFIPLSATFVSSSASSFHFWIFIVAIELELLPYLQLHLIPTFWLPERA